MQTKGKPSVRTLQVLIILLAVILMAVLAVLMILDHDQNQPEPTDAATQQPTYNNTAEPTQTTEQTQPEETQPPTDPPFTGWSEANGNTYYLISDVPCTGIQAVDGVTYCFGTDGALQYSCWLDIGENRYYADENGSVYTGWLELDGNLYYLKEDGIMARGQLEIEDETWFFTSTGCQLYLVNPWHYIPDDYKVTLVDVPSQFGDYRQVAEECYDDLMRMLRDCNKAMAQIYGEGVHEAFVKSANRTNGDQQYLFDNKVSRVKSAHPEYTQAEAEAAAAKVVAVPGTSEHQLGLAVDVVDSQLKSLVTAQEDMPVQQWLMEHCYEYGFILQYPKGTTDVTGIIYEPWHYRYVGAELAAEIQQLGITLEEYIAGLTNS